MDPSHRQQWNDAIDREISRVTERLGKFQKYLDDEFQNLDDIERGSLIRWVQKQHDKLDALEQAKRDGPPPEAAEIMSNGGNYTNEFDRLNRKLDSIQQKVNELDVNQRLIIRDLSDTKAEMDQLKVRLRSPEPNLSRPVLIVGGISLVIMFGMIVWILLVVS